MKCVLFKFNIVWHKAISMEHPMRIELIIVISVYSGVRTLFKIKNHIEIYFLLIKLLLINS